MTRIDPASDLAALREYLTERDVACPSCAYNLRGLTVDRCPECNEFLVLRVSMAEPKLGAWLGTLSGLLACCGGALICVLLVVYLSIFEKGWPRGREFFPVVVYPVLILIVEGVLVGWLASTRGRRWFRAHNPRARRCMVVVSWSALFLAVAAFVLMIRH